MGVIRIHRRFFFLFVTLFVAVLFFLSLLLYPGYNMWKMDSQSCRSILGTALPIVQEEDRWSVFEPLGLIRLVLEQFWLHTLASPRHVLQGEIPFLFSFDPDPYRGQAYTREPTTVSAQIQIDEHLFRTTPAKETDIKQTLSPSVAIFHTHTSETYHDDVRATDGNSHVIPPGVFKGQVVDVGARVKEHLEQKGLTVIHDTTIYDQVHNMAYLEARQGIEELISDYDDLNLILDIHRDGLEHLGRDFVTTKIQGRPAARVLLVISKNMGQENLGVAQRLERIMESIYPGLLRGITVRELRGYNQDLHPGLILMEIGGVLSYKEEALYTAKLLSKVIYTYILEVQEVL